MTKLDRCHEERVNDLVYIQPLDIRPVIESFKDWKLKYYLPYQSVKNVGFMGL